MILYCEYSILSNKYYIKDVSKIGKIFNIGRVNY